MNSNWFRVPDFLWEEVLSTQDSGEIKLPPIDPEVKRIVVNAVHAEQQRIALNRLEQFSDWTRLVMAISVIKKFLSKVKDISQQTIRQHSELVIMRLLQAEV